MRKGNTERVEDQAAVWREGLEEAVRERVREVIERFSTRKSKRPWAQPGASAWWGAVATGMGGRCGA